jgi:hypothetical protein
MENKLSGPVTGQHFTPIPSSFYEQLTGRLNCPITEK